MDSDAECVLDTLAAAATRRAALRGQAALLRGEFKCWRAALDAVVQRGVEMAWLSVMISSRRMPASGFRMLSSARL